MFLALFTGMEQDAQTRPAIRRPRGPEAALELERALQQRTRELEESRARFRDIIERNADAILVVDRAGEIRFANLMAAELFNSERSALTGTPFGFPVLVGETTELDLARDGDARIVEMRVVDSEWEGETAYLATLRDITERKRVEENARHLIREQTARTMAEAAASRFRFLAEASTILAEPLEYTETLTILAGLCASELADWAVVYMVNEVGELERLEVAHCDPDKAEAAAALREHRLPIAGSHPVVEVLRTREPLLVSEVDEAGFADVVQDPEHEALIRELGLGSYMVVPLLARGRVLGVIAMMSSDPDRRFSDDELAVAQDLALRAGLAIDNVRLFREAQEANRAKSHLLAAISHDLRTPLNAIMGYTDLLGMGIPEPIGAVNEERVGRIRSSATHLLYLIDELLSFARLDAGHEEVRLSDVDARALVTEVAGVIEPLALERGLQLRLEVPDEPTVLHSDPDRLRQILLNLVGNALKYTNEGEVCVGFDPPRGGTICFHVRDTGIGIQPGHLEQIFEPFWRADPARNGDGGNRSSGLGLSVVRRLVELLDGAIHVKSEVGRGSLFTVQLPLHPG
jgi:signal transduction histidine kinase